MIRTAAAYMAALLLTGAGAGAGELPIPLRNTAPGLKPVGEATLHWFGLHIYDVALFAAETPFAGDGTAALSIRYNISIKHRRLLDTTLKEWRRMGRGAAAQHERWMRELEPMWPDLKPGDRLTAFRRAGGPTQFYFGDRLLGEIADTDFGPAFFAIWLDPKCRYPEVRARLLGADQADKKGG